LGLMDCGALIARVDLRFTPLGTHLGNTGRETRRAEAGWWAPPAFPASGDNL